MHFFHYFRYTWFFFLEERRGHCNKGQYRGNFLIVIYMVILVATILPMTRLPRQRWSSSRKTSPTAVILHVMRRPGQWGGVSWTDLEAHLTVQKCCWNFAWLPDWFRFLLPNHSPSGYKGYSSEEQQLPYNYLAVAQSPPPRGWWLLPSRPRKMVMQAFCSFHLGQFWVNPFGADIHC